MIFNMKKEDLYRKARYVVGGYVVDLIYLKVCSLVVQISIRILLKTVQKYNLEIISGDIGNIFLYMLTNKRIHTIANKEFRDRQECMVKILKSLHGIAIASRSWSLHLGDFIYSLGYMPLRADSGK